MTDSHRSTEIGVHVDVKAPADHPGDGAVGRSASRHAWLRGQWARRNAGSSLGRRAKKTELSRETVTKIYGRWAPVYDFVFGSVFDPGRHAAIAASERIGGRILDVGVGTGIALPHYAQSARVVGVDLSEAMLHRARERVAAQRLRNIEGLAVMDAERLAFPDASFEVVVAQYVINTVPKPEATLDELARVLKPGGEIVLLNRIGAEMGPRRTVERWLMPLVGRLGWRSEFPWARFARWAERTRGVHLIERRPMPPFGHFALIRFAKSDPFRSHGMRS